MRMLRYLLESKQSTLTPWDLQPSAGPKVQELTAINLLFNLAVFHLPLGMRKVLFTFLRTPVWKSIFNSSEYILCCPKITGVSNCLWPRSYTDASQPTFKRNEIWERSAPLKIRVNFYLCCLHQVSGFIVLLREVDGGTIFYNIKVKGLSFDKTMQ